MQLIGIDIGTKNIKGVLVTDQGKILDRQSVHQETISRFPGWAEQNPDIWWKRFISVIHKLLLHPEAEKNRIGGIGISGHFPTIVIADRTGTPLHHAILYSDNRAEEELEQFNRSFGLNATEDSVVPKLAWLANHYPEIYNNVRYFFGPHTYIGYRLTDEYYLDFKVAHSWGGLLNPKNLQWRKDVADWIGISKQHLPKLYSAKKVIGTITKEASSQTGLPMGIPVIAGSGDSFMTLIGSGALRKGDVLLSLGTTGWLAVLPEDLEDYLNNPTLLNKGAPYILSAYLLSVGSAIDWLINEFSHHQNFDGNKKKSSIYQLLDNCASDSHPPMSDLFILPFFSGSRHKSKNEPTSGGIFGLTLSHKFINIYRALLESFGYVIRASLKDPEIENFRIDKLFSTGGGAESNLLKQIICDISQVKIIHHRISDACLGNAFLAGYSVGLNKNITDIKKWLTVPEVSLPTKENSKRYDLIYKKFLAMKNNTSKM